jgi:hypothetical protein
LRCALLVALLWAGFGQTALAKPTVKLLVGTTVADTAQATMSAALWRTLIADWIGGQVVTFPDGTPTLADCRNAGADYMAAALFELRPHLPGMPNSSGRVAARTNITVTNCLTGTITYDQTINLDSEPRPETTNDSELDSAAMWAHSVPPALAAHPALFARAARIISVRPPQAIVDVRGANPGDVLRVYAGADRKAKGPIYLTVTRQLGKNVEATFSTLDGVPQPAAGDFVELASKPKP